MDNIVKMAIAHRIDDRPDCIRCFFLWVVLFLYNTVKELAARHQLQNYKKLWLRLEHLEHIHYVGVVNLRSL